jgi:hypothetical protein
MSHSCEPDDLVARKTDSGAWEWFCRDCGARLTEADAARLILEFTLQSESQAQDLNQLTNESKDNQQWPNVKSEFSRHCSQWR